MSEHYPLFSYCWNVTVAQGNLVEKYVKGRTKLYPLLWTLIAHKSLLTKHHPWIWYILLHVKICRTHLSYNASTYYYSSLEHVSRFCKRNIHLPQLLITKLLTPKFTYTQHEAFPGRMLLPTLAMKKSRRSSNLRTDSFRLSFLFKVYLTCWTKMLHRSLCLKTKTSFY